MSEYQEPEKKKKTRVMIATPGSTYSQSFLLCWTQALYTLWKTDRYDVMICPGKSSFVPFARMQTMGLNVLRGKKQKPFNNEEYDIYVTLDSDIIFNANYLVELIECTRLHPVVSGYYMMADNKHFATVKEWDKEYFLKFGTFQFLQPGDMEPYIKKAQDIAEERRKKEEAKEPLDEMPMPEFIPVSYTGLGFFACRKEVLNSLEYPYFNRELQKIRGKDGIDVVDMCSEDVAFCKNIQDAGYNIMLHTQLRVGHEKSVVL